MRPCSPPEAGHQTLLVLPFWCCPSGVALLVLPSTRNILKAHTLPNFEVAGMLEMHHQIGAKKHISFSQCDDETFRSRTRGRTGIGIL